MKINLKFRHVWEHTEKWNELKKRKKGFEAFEISTLKLHQNLKVLLQTAIKHNKLFSNFKKILIGMS